MNPLIIALWTLRVLTALAALAGFVVLMDLITGDPLFLRKNRKDLAWKSSREYKLKLFYIGAPLFLLGGLVTFLLFQI